MRLLPNTPRAAWDTAANTPCSVFECSAPELVHAASAHGHVKVRLILQPRLGPQERAVRAIQLQGVRDVVVR